MTDNGSYGSPEGVQSTVATVPKSVADGLAEALWLIAESSNQNAHGFRAWAKRRANHALIEYRKATQ